MGDVEDAEQAENPNQDQAEKRAGSCSEKPALAPPQEYQPERPGYDIDVETEVPSYREAPDGDRPPAGSAGAAGALVGLEQRRAK
jgi:hypothetical protein